MQGHEAALSQCLTNLLSNAVKFTRRGEVAQVRIWSERRSSPSPSPSGKLDASAARPTPVAPRATVRLWVEDQGIGMAADARVKIFGIFVRLNSSELYEGSGIGLSIVTKAIHRMGGQVGVESELGQGSRFWLELPEG